jgi:hypothetical protein
MKRRVMGQSPTETTEQFEAGDGGVPGDVYPRLRDPSTGNGSRVRSGEHAGDLIST